MEPRPASPPHTGASPPRLAEPMRVLPAPMRPAGRIGAAKVVLALGPTTVLVGLVWALVQPYRITLLDPEGQSFWWLLAQPPLLVILAGVVFHVTVARGLVRDLEEGEARRGDDR